MTYYNLDTYKDTIKNLFSKKIETIFVNKFSFEGDEQFDIFKQKLFLKTIYNHGRAAVFYHNNKMVICRYYPLSLNAVGLTAYDGNGVVNGGTGYPAFRSQHLDGLHKDTFVLKKDHNAVFHQPIGEALAYQNSLATHIIQLAEQYANMFLAAAMGNMFTYPRMVTIDEQSAKNITAKIRAYEDIVLSLTDNIDSTDKVDFLSNLASKLGETFELLKFEGVDLEKQLSAIEKFQSLLYGLIGIRHNQTFKKERMTTDEVGTDGAQYRLLEIKLKDEFEWFIKM